MSSLSNWLLNSNPDGVRPGRKRLKAEKGLGIDGSMSPSTWTWLEWRQQIKPMKIWTCAVVDKVQEEMLISDLVVDGGAPMAMAVTKGKSVAASDEGHKWVPKSLGQLTLMCPGLSGFRIWEPGGLSHLKEIIDQNSGSSGVVLKEDSSLLAMLQILLDQDLRRVDYETFTVVGITTHHSVYRWQLVDI